MQIETHKLIGELNDIVQACQHKVKEFTRLDSAVLNHKPGPGKWSVLECIEHLNLYGDFYLPEMEKSIVSASGSKPSEVFSTGLVGGYFAKLMKVSQDGKMTKMKSPGDKNPVNSELSATVLDRFLKQQEKLLVLMNRAASVDLKRAKTPITLTRLIRLRLGDTFRFYVYHVERHVLQAEKAVVAAGMPAHKLQFAD